MKVRSKYYSGIFLYFRKLYKTRVELFLTNFYIYFFIIISFKQKGKKKSKHEHLNTIDFWENYAYLICSFIKLYWRKRISVNVNKAK